MGEPQIMKENIDNVNKKVDDDTPEKQPLPKKQKLSSKNDQNDQEKIVLSKADVLKLRKTYFSSSMSISYENSSPMQ